MHDDVEFVAVDDEQTPAISRAMDGIFLQGNTAVVALEAAEKFVVVAHNIDDFGALAAFAEKLLDNVVVGLGPENASAKGPDIDEVAYEVEFLEFRIAEEIQKSAGVASPGSQVNVRYPA